MKLYSDSLDLKTGLEKYFQENGFSEHDYNRRWALVELGPFPFLFPNIKARRDALPFHDFHHVLTGYETTVIGEAEIGAWELASGCSMYPAALFFNSLAVAIGIVTDRKRVIKAFLRGRRCQNLYSRKLDPELTSTTLGKLREELYLKFSEDMN